MLFLELIIDFLLHSTLLLSLLVAVELVNVQFFDREERHEDGIYSTKYHGLIFIVELEELLPEFFFRLVQRYILFEGLTHVAILQEHAPHFFTVNTQVRLVGLQILLGHEHDGRILQSLLLVSFEFQRQNALVFLLADLVYHSLLVVVPELVLGERGLSAVLRHDLLQEQLTQMTFLGEYVHLEQRLLTNEAHGVLLTQLSAVLLFRELLLDLLCGLGPGSTRMHKIKASYLLIFLRVSE